MEHTLTQQRKSRSVVSHPFNKLQLVHFPLDEAVVLGKSEPCHHCCLVSFNTTYKALEFTNVACTNLRKPVVKLFSLTAMQESGSGIRPGAGR